jgi:hypothetical protein
MLSAPAWWHLQFSDPYRNITVDSRARMGGSGKRQCFVKVATGDVTSKSTVSARFLKDLV